MERLYDIKTRYIDQTDKLTAKKEIFYLADQCLQTMIENDFLANPVNEEASIVYLNRLLKMEKIIIKDSCLNERVKEEYYNYLKELREPAKDMSIRYGISASFNISEAHDRFLIYDYPKKKYVETYYNMQNPDYEIEGCDSFSEWILERSHRMEFLEQLTRMSGKNIWDFPTVPMDALQGEDNLLYAQAIIKGIYTNAFIWYFKNYKEDFLKYYELCYCGSSKDGWIDSIIRGDMNEWDLLLQTL